MTPEDDLPCRELVQLVTDHLDGALDGVTEARLVEHLEDCTGCVRYLGQVRTTIALLGDLPAPGLPAATRDRLLEAYRARRSPFRA